MSTDTPTAERDVEARVRKLAHSLPPSDFGSTRAIQAVAAFVENETRRLRAELEQARAFETLVREYLGEYENPALGINYRISLRDRLRAALSSSPGESAKESSEADHG